MPAELSRRRQTWLLVALLGGMFLGSVDIAIVNIAAPSIRDTLGASGSELELIVSGYTLTYAMLLVTSARLGDMRGHRRMYLIGLVLFTASSALCGLAPSALTLTIARVLQGAGAALLTSQVLIGIQLHFDGKAKARALGLYTAVLSTSAVVGQVLGGVIVSADLWGTSWRPAFLVNVPVGLALVALVLKFVPADAPKSDKKLDLPGVATLSAAMLLLVVPLVMGRDLGWPAWTWVSLVLSAVLVAAFVVVERRQVARGGYPLVNLELVTDRPIALALLSQALTVATYFALLFTLALYLQQGLGLSALVSGLSLVAWVAAFGISGPLLGRASARTRRLAGPVGRVVLAVAFAAVAGALVAGFAGNQVLLVVLLGLGGLGYGAAFSGTLTHITSTAPARYAADVSGLFNTTLQVGGTLGVAVFGTIYLDLAPAPGRDAGVHAFGVVTGLLAATVLAAAVLAYLAIRPALAQEAGQARDGSSPAGQDGAGLPRQRVGGPGQSHSVGGPGQSHSVGGPGQSHSAGEVGQSHSVGGLGQSHGAGGSGQSRQRTRP
ncbi:MFS transporter [Actinokineospora globicatena]|uniref:MFS transporter n=1 Tax=Actinokineospora globicatena TaxID=103729 RepID=UPI0020A24CEC|nr:MFS transporter [Actinokineospora globicatena]MCP2306752.1 Major Facilitator Superfamily protein [Actinokineospora globicatena]GLW82129.1 MFS transporter [Actinokineospora globicatena]GLW88922.1 MFS transporter [Actinokineospora globicatena]